MRDVNAMLGGFVRTDENHGDVPSVAFFQNSIFVDVHFAENGAELAEQRGNGGLGFFAKVTAGARIERNAAWAAGRELRIFRGTARAHISLPSG